MRELRKVYQIKQIVNYNKRLPIEVGNDTIPKWMHCYKHNEKYSHEFPLEIDKSRFAYVIIKNLFSIQVNFNLENDLNYIKKVNQINVNFNTEILLKYSEDFKSFNKSK